MRTSDADLGLWLEGAGGRSYHLAVVSRRRGRRGSAKWERPVYVWWVESWWTWANKEDAEETTSTRVAVAKTFTGALRLAQRTADRLERKARS